MELQLASCNVFGLLRVGVGRSMCFGLLDGTGEGWGNLRGWAYRLRS